MKLTDYLSVIKLLKRFGIFIYTGNKIDDIELIQSELRDMYEYGLLLKEDYLKALLIVKNEKRKLQG